MKDEQLDAALDAWAEGRIGDEVTEDAARALVARAKAAPSRGPGLLVAGVGAAGALMAALAALAIVGLAAWMTLGRPKGVEPVPVVTLARVEADLLVAEGDVSTEGGLALVGEGALVASVGEDRVGLGADSAVRLEGSAEDLVVLLDRGEVAVQAGKRTSGSLVVRAGEITVGVIGTRFSVERLDDGVRVEVAEGRVSVARAGGLVEVGAGRFVAIRSGVLTEGDADSRGVDTLLRLVVDEPAPEVEAPAAAPVKAPAWDPAEARERVLAGDPAIRAELEARVAAHPDDGVSWALLAAVQVRADEPAAAAVSFGHAADHTQGAASARHRFRQAELVEPTDPAVAAALFGQAAVPEAGALLPDARLGQGRARKAAGDPAWRAPLEQVLAEHPSSAAAVEARKLLAP